MKNIFIFTLFLLLTYTAANSQTDVNSTGVIKYFNLEGGFYGIVTEDNTGYLPMNLQNEYKVDGLKISFSGTTVEDVMTTQQWGIVIQLKSINQIVVKPESGYDVHEWGVMVGCPEDENFFLTSRPEKIMDVMVKEPVLYIHSADKNPFSLRVKFLNGKQVLNYPEAEIENDEIYWKSVSFHKERGELKSQSPNKPRDFVPLSSIIRTLNNVDSDLLEYNGTKSRFLFYEGEMKLNNQISAAYNSEKKEVIFKNGSDYPVYNLVYVRGNIVFFLKELNPCEEGFGQMKKKSDNIFISDMVNLGFTIREAVSFWELWEDSFYDLSGFEYKENLIYRIPDEMYEKNVSLTFDPLPNKLTRAMYVLVHKK
jgi:hypothetical protein